MSTLGQDPTMDQGSLPSGALGGEAITRDQARAVLGQVMGLVALTVGCAALGAYIGRDLSGGMGIFFFLAALACVFGLNIASSRGREQLAVGFLFGLGLLLGLAVAPLLAVYAKAEPSVLWQAAGVTGAFVAALGAYGYATRRDLSSWARGLFWALLALIAFGIVSIFVTIPNGNIIYCVLGLVILAGTRSLTSTVCAGPTWTARCRSPPASSWTSSTSSCFCSPLFSGERQ